MSVLVRDQLNAEQLRAVRHRGAPLRIIAGAGTGKTATLTARFVDLVERGDAGIDEILALTFTRKAADEMRQRIENELDRSFGTIWVRTFHSFCQVALRLELTRLGQSAPQVIEDDERLLLLSAALDGIEFPGYVNRRDELFRQALLFIDRVKDECLTPSEALALAQRRGHRQMAELAEVYNRYQRQLRAEQAFDFGELQMRFIDILERDERALARWQGRFEHILIDEYQDVNRAQARVIKLLAGDGERLTVVGDRDQAIYAFRGASHEFIEDMPQDYPGTKTIRLERNYRSHQAILDAANALIAHNRHDDDARAVLTAETQGAGPKPVVYRAESEMDEAAMIARQIARLHWLDGVRFQDVAVLLRSVAVAGGAVAQAIREYDIPVVFAGRDYETTRAQTDVAATLRLLDAEEIDDLCHILASHDVDRLQLLRAQAEGEQASAFIEEWMRSDEDARRAISHIRGEVAQLRDNTLPEQVYGALRICKRLPPPDQPTHQDIAYMRAFRQILSRATRLAERGEGRQTLLRVIDDALGADVQETESSGDAVQLMTVHAAKGLEFDHVFVAGLADGRFPLTRRLDRGLDLQDPASWRIDDTGTSDGAKREAFLEEERRLGYVALTRSRKSLFLSYAQSYGQEFESEPTFLTNIRATNEQALAPLDRSTERRSWSATEYARAQRELLNGALAAPEVSGDAIGDLLLSQWTLAQLPDSSVWTPPVAPRAFNGDEELRLSYTTFSAWEKCRRQYYYNYVLRLDGDQHSPQMTLGTAVHDTIEWMNKERQGGHLPSEGRLIETFRDAWDGDGFEAPAQERQNRERGEQLLRRFYRWEIHQQREILETELSFEIPFGRHTLLGRIDCVSRDRDGRLEIIDYKSGRKGGTSKNDAIPQLALYRMAWELSHPEDSPRTSLYFLRSNGDKGLNYVPEFKFNTHSWALDLEPEQIDEVRGRLAAFANGVLNNDFTPISDPQVCRNCPFTSICEGAASND